MSDTKSENYAYVIPAYNPDEHLIGVVNSLREISDNIIFIINDGSKEDSSKIFTKLKSYKYSNVYIIEHAINLGKGAALKTIFNYILTNFKEIEGVITLDSDGQHSAKDCLNVLETLKSNKDSFVLGYREFSKDIPLKSYIGNNISKFIYKIILGKEFKDTQTGLRGISKELMKKCLTISSNRFEFETEQLALVAEKNINTIEVPIETIYIENNKASSFRPLVDSFRIYFILFRYLFSSIATAIVDFIVFMVSLSFGANIFTANILARTASIGVQFVLLDRFVFYSNSKFIKFILFATYVYIMGALSAWTQVGVVEHFGISVVLAKILVEGLLFFINFAVLRLYIFTKTKIGK